MALYITVGIGYLHFSLICGYIYPFNWGVEKGVW